MFFPWITFQCFPSSQFHTATMPLCHFRMTCCFVGISPAMLPEHEHNENQDIFFQRKQNDWKKALRDKMPHFCVLCEVTPKTGSLVECSRRLPWKLHDIPAPHVSAIAVDDRPVEWQCETQDETTQNDTERCETTCSCHVEIKPHETRWCTMIQCDVSECLTDRLERLPRMADPNQCLDSGLERFLQSLNCLR